VYTVKNPNYPIVDTSLKNDLPDHIEILRQSIFEPNNLLSQKAKKNKQSAGFLNPNPSFFGKILQYIRANYFIPDARKFWIKPSITYLENYIKNHKIDTIITTGPPHSVHLIGLGLKKKFQIKWIADFRDPWTKIDYFHQLPLTKRAKAKHHQLEQAVLKNADTVLVVGKTMQNDYLKFNKNTQVITNGYDSFNDVEPILLDDKFTLLHIGMLNSDRNHIMLWEVLSELINEIPNFSNDLEIKLIGKVCNEAIEAISKYDLAGYLNQINYVKHNDVIKHQMSAQVLLLLINNVPSAKGIITGKIFEYLQANRPILAIAPENGDLAEIIINTNSGFIVDFNDKIALKELILELYERYKNGSLEIDNKNVEQYHRRKLTEKLVHLIHK
jgi:glycosyltransferase involved in cell wall biosynthesis